MKKSKIIIPALALLAFTSISTVSGTVAWFTANRGATFSASTFEVVSADGNLKRSLAAGTATSISTEGADTGNILVQDTSGNQNKLSDASYDVTTFPSTVWTDIPNDDGSQATEFETKEYGTAISTNVYYAATWTCTYTYTFGGDTNNVNLYLNVADCFKSFSATVGSGTSSLKTNLGFRVGVKSNQTGQVGKALAPKQVRANCKYVDKAKPGTSGSPAVVNYASYTTSNLIASDDTITAVPAGTKGAADRIDCFGTFTTKNTAITISFIAWFEGSDPNVVSGATMDKVSMSFPFYTRLAA